MCNHACNTASFLKLHLCLQDAMFLQYFMMVFKKIFNWIWHWRDAKKWNWEKEKCRDLFSGSRKEWEFLQKDQEICNFFPISRRKREILKTNLMILEEIETSRFQTFHDKKLWEREIHLPPFTFLFLFYFYSVLKTKKFLWHKEEFWRNIPEKKIVCWRILSP